MVYDLGKLLLFLILLKMGENLSGKLGEVLWVSHLERPFEKSLNQLFLML